MPFHTDDFFGRQIRRLVAYYHRNEYEDGSPKEYPKRHIFHALKALGDLEYISLPLVLGSKALKAQVKKILDYDWEIERDDFLSTYYPESLEKYYVKSDPPDGMSADNPDSLPLELILVLGTEWTPDGRQHIYQTMRYIRSALKLDPRR